MERNKHYTIALTEEQKEIVLQALAKHIQGLESVHDYHSMRHEHKYAAVARDRIGFASKLREQVLSAESQEATTELPTAWHSVKDQLPEDDADVVVFNGEEYAVASLWKMSNGTSAWVTPTDGYHTESITAWREMEPYRAEEEKP